MAVIRLKDDCRVAHSEMKKLVKSELSMASVPSKILTLQDLGNLVAIVKPPMPPPLI